MKIGYIGLRLALVVNVIVLASGTAWSQTSLDPMLKPYLSRFGLPAVAAAVVKKGEVVSAGAVGMRRAGTDTPVTINDRFHLGSDTKAMTATIAAMLVEEGRLRWVSTVAEVFPELADKMDPELRRVTLEQLLSHTSGAPADNKDFGELLQESLTQEGNLDELRYRLVAKWSRLPLASKPGTGFVYSNMNYTIVGAMTERVTGKTWDELITERVFRPLALGTVGLGCQASLGRIDAPLPHRVVEGKVKAFLAGPNCDNPPIIGPAGIAHMSVLDFARWAGWNAGEGKRGPALVRQETIRKLHLPVVTMPEKKDAAPGTPPGGKYALGWGELSVNWAPYPLLYHGGSNGMNLAHIWIDVKRDLAIVTVTNIAGPEADQALMTLAGELYARSLGE
jgi:CubicO group peptidase (beta-lactamase class C family)